jgi:hypothetical protein
MYAYIYQAAMLCEGCAQQAQHKLGSNADTGDSNDYPQGPYGEGGGEADSPQHCDHCGEFLENPLTSEGEAFVRQAIANAPARAEQSGDCLETWHEFYSYLFETTESEWDNY